MPLKNIFARQKGRRDHSVAANEPPFQSRADYKVSNQGDNYAPVFLVGLLAISFEKDDVIRSRSCYSTDSQCVFEETRLA